MNFDVKFCAPGFHWTTSILLLLRNKRALYYEYQDLYPESFFNKMNSALIHKIFKPLCLVDRFIARRSNHLTVVSESMKEVYITKRKIEESKISVLFNWQDENEFLKPISEKEFIIAKYDLDFLKDKFVFMYLGNIGPVAGVDVYQSL
jgi:glycosyltransferase involved in cell wall biosynthesis